MAPPTSGDITALLRRLSDGDQSVEAQLIPLVYEHLRRTASRYLRSERDGHTLQTTDLVHEAYVRLRDGPQLVWADRVHFFAVAATVMRRVLVDAARSRKSLKRGGNADVFALSVEAVADPHIDDREKILAVDAALSRLADLDSRQARIVELRFFAGMTMEEISEVLRISIRTVKRDWRLARAWLYGELAT